MGILFAKGGPVNFGTFFVSFFGFCFVFRGFWLLASVAFGFRGFCGFWLSWLLWLLAFWPIHLFVSISICLYLSTFLSFFLAAVLLSLFAFAFPVVCVAETKPNKEASKQGSKQARAAHLWIWCAAGGALPPPPTPPNPPRATKSALHPRRKTF